MIRSASRKPGLSIAKTIIRAAKVNAIFKLSKVIKIQICVQNENEKHTNGRKICENDNLARVKHKN